jgi:hypothetical protein
MFPNPPRHLSKITIIILRNGKKLKYCIINTYISIGMPKIALFSQLDFFYGRGEEEQSPYL